MAWGMSELNSPAGDDVPDDGDPFYTFKASLAGSPFLLWLRRDGIEWNFGRRSGTIRYDSIRRVRLAYRPATMQAHRFTAEIWSTDAPKLLIISTSWQGLVVQQRQDAPYAAFMIELHRRLAAAHGAARFQTGMPAPLYALGLGVITATTAAFAVLVYKAIELAEWRSVLVIGAVFAVFGWQLSSYILRNRPGEYQPSAIPPRVLPKG